MLIRNTHHIRTATAMDGEALLGLMKEHALYEGHKLRVIKQGERLSDPTRLPLTLFVVESKEELLGYASVTKQFSTWDMDWYLYLDCLYLREDARGRGIGLELMQRLECYAKENGIALIQWQTPSDNASAIGFYLGLGASCREKQRFFWPLSPQ
ncbi:GNAT family N-acetyltransferase [Shewanella sp. AS16]|uniref:GNAT family N-acetyltransferase n=1 Tax=Shewanella sp. AS16 TaxID=2907625 RepID=UPI001F326A77|nr:GNAT family N-acetyltransferase [Shewanella sp. AS16]MCE9688150.1 GNAT family N-acetyltransferase [Shewanella sp. AS16]